METKINRIKADLASYGVRDGIEYCVTGNGLNHYVTDTNKRRCYLITGNRLDAYTLAVKLFNDGTLAPSYGE